MTSPLLPLAVLAGLLLSACAPSTATLNELRTAREELRVTRDDLRLCRQVAKGHGDEMERALRQYLDKTSEQFDELNRLRETARQYPLLQAAHESLKERHRQLEEWAGELGRGYGPGIWKQGEFSRPLYARAPRVATPQGVIDELNAEHRTRGNPLLVLKKIDQQVAHLGTSDDRKVTRRMSSYGAKAYLNEAAYSLASLPEITCVVFDIDEGDHAGPDKVCP